MEGRTRRKKCGEGRGIKLVLIASRRGWGKRIFFRRGEGERRRGALLLGKTACRLASVPLFTRPDGCRGLARSRPAPLLATLASCFVRCWFCGALWPVATSGNFY